MARSTWPRSTMNDVRARFALGHATINQALGRFADRHLSRVAEPVGEAIRYSLLGEGKRMRGLLVLSAYDAAGGTGDAAELAAAIEVVHA